MALTPTTMIDSPECLMVVYVDLSKQDGAVGQVDITNRKARPSRPIVAWARYNGTLVYSPPVSAGTTYTRTFRGASARAGDVDLIGYY